MVPVPFAPRGRNRAARTDKFGVPYAESGVHFVNRLGYFVSETPFQTDEYLSFCLDDEMSDDEAQR
jgi:hypothetical protein